MHIRIVGLSARKDCVSFSRCCRGSSARGPSVTLGSGDSCTSLRYNVGHVCTCLGNGLLGISAELVGYSRCLFCLLPSILHFAMRSVVDCYCVTLCSERSLLKS